MRLKSLRHFQKHKNILHWNISFSSGFPSVSSSVNVENHKLKWSNHHRGSTEAEINSPLLLRILINKWCKAERSFIHWITMKHKAQIYKKKKKKVSDCRLPNWVHGYSQAHQNVFILVKNHKEWHFLRDKPNPQLITRILMCSDHWVVHQTLRNPVFQGVFMWTFFLCEHRIPKDSKDRNFSNYYLK